MTSVLKRDRTEDTHREKRRGHMKMKAEIGVMQTHAKEFQEPPEAGTGKQVFSSTAFRGSALISDFWLPEL